MAVLPNGAWQGWYEHLGRITPMVTNMVFVRGSISGRGEDEGGEFEVAGSYHPVSACVAETIVSVEWRKQYTGRHSLQYRANVIRVHGSTRRVQFSGSWSLPPDPTQNGAKGIFELLSLSPAPSPFASLEIDQSPSRNSWGISRLNSAYYCIVTDVTREARDDGLANIIVSFVAVGDGSLGPLQDPGSSQLSWGTNEFVRPERHTVSCEERWSRRLTGTLVYEGIPSKARLCFTYGMSGHSAVIIAAPSRKDNAVGQASVGFSASGEGSAAAPAGATQGVQSVDGVVASIVSDLVDKVREVRELRARLAELRCRDVCSLRESVAAESGGSRSSVQSSSNAVAPAVESETSCLICVDAPRNTVLLWCGHQVLCVQCAKVLFDGARGCPICRQPIGFVQKVFLS